MLLRQGGISADDIRKTVGSVQFGKAVLERPLAPWSARQSLFAKYPA